jgi:predicted amidophosphoribosyltransferase
MSLAGTMRYFIGLATDQLLPHQCLLYGRPVILVDDVMASGATLAAAARCLLAPGSCPVKGLVVARVL